MSKKMWDAGKMQEGGPGQNSRGRKALIYS